MAGDIRDPHGVKNAMAGCDAVAHLAALIAIPFSYNSPDSYVDTNIKGTLNVLQAARELSIKRIIHTSTSEVYGTAKIVPITEEHPLQGQSPYVLNAGFTYSDDKRNLSLTATANRVGQRIFIVGTVNDADIYENARTVLDIQAAKSYFKGNLELKLNIKDALAQQQLFYFDLNSDTKYKENDDKIFSTTNLGRVISLSVSYKF